MQPGTRLGPYEVLAAIGKGGMGEVWKARDSRLDREVAIKTLPSELADNPDGLARFEREAKLLAVLNHPNIAAIYGLDESDGIRPHRGGSGRLPHASLKGLRQERARPAA